MMIMGLFKGVNDDLSLSELWCREGFLCNLSVQKRIQTGQEMEMPLWNEFYH